MITYPRIISLLTLLLALTMVGCATTPSPPPEPLTDEARRLIDPLTGYEPDSTTLANSSSQAWREFQSGRFDSAERGWQQILTADAEFAPALVGLASIALARGQLERARELLGDVEPYPASLVLRAEILASDGRVVEAAELLSPIVARPDTPSVVAVRFADLREDALNRLVAEARAAQVPEDRTRLLRRAVSLAPGDLEIRLDLVEALVSAGKFGEAREALSPALDRDATLNRVQAALAEIEIGEEKYQNAMRRYERLVERTGDVVYRERLELAKRLWNESTYPKQFQLAVRSPNITREQLAVLLFWKLPSIRFAQNLEQPPIVVDLAEVMGREELIRALALGLLPLDRSTRQARPRRTVTVSQFLAAAASALELVSSDPCTTAETETPVEQLHACGIDTLKLESNPSGFVTGAGATVILDQIAELDRSAE
ncbi:MAG: tetratricopeptide repeat protein [Thermoanaerobaculia bacterium]|nr:tetratricopeptide repeat protein [Thermoanaerobaculia bacterium]